MTTSLNKKPVVALVLVGLIVTPNLSQAAENKGAVESAPRVGAPSGRPAKPPQEEIERLQRLKKENPEEFRRVVQERREKLQERLAYLKEHDPEAYKRTMAELAKRRMNRLMELKKNNPEEYKRVMAQQKERMEQRREELRKKDPKAYQELMERQMVRRVQTLEKLKQTMKPEAYERFLNDNPEWAESLKQWNASHKTPETQTESGGQNQ